MKTKDPSTGKYIPLEGACNKNLNTRVSQELYEQVKKVAKEKTGAWIREAILEKLEREKSYLRQLESSVEASLNDF